jgi:hypothetical protein
LLHVVVLTVLFERELAHKSKVEEIAAREIVDAALKEQRIFRTLDGHLGKLLEYAPGEKCIGPPLGKAALTQHVPVMRPGPRRLYHNPKDVVWSRRCPGRCAERGLGGLTAQGSGVRSRWSGDGHELHPPDTLDRVQTFGILS